MEIKQELLTIEIEDILIKFSKEWEVENNCYGYRTNSSTDLEDRTILMAYENNLPIGYLFGIYDTIEKDNAIMPKNSRTFELEEIYIKKSYLRGLVKNSFSI